MSRRKSTIRLVRDKDGEIFVEKIVDKRIGLEEFRIQNALDHLNIVKCFDIFTGRKDYGKNDIGIKMEYCKEGDLIKFFDKNNIDTVDEIIDILLDIAHGLSYIHSSNFVHLDLKPENIFVTSNFTAKIGDFGLSKERGHKMRKNGTKKYMCPEIFNMSNNEYIEANYSMDIWSYGKVAEFIVDKNIELFEYKRTILKKITNMIEGCCKHNRSERYVVSDIIEILESLKY